MTDIQFSAKEKEAMTERLREYVQEELDHELSRFEAEFLLGFFTKEIGVYFYNRGLYDAQAILTKRLEDLTESILSLEKPTNER
ncbi:MAG: DUF2164 domain-containing protein [Candidatus Kapabacteria bacterium]|nr:DUF2164 domain-containing protein [Candidatus Kapabacteria bacterium]